MIDDVHFQRFLDKTYTLKYHRAGESKCAMRKIIFRELTLHQTHTEVDEKHRDTCLFVAHGASLGSGTENKGRAATGKRAQFH